jgi:hypothetical protein
MPDSSCLGPVVNYLKLKSESKEIFWRKISCYCPIEKKKCYVVKLAYCSKIYLLTAVQGLNVIVANVVLVSVFQVFHVVISNIG